jgi:hypothetical protein
MTIGTVTTAGTVTGQPAWKALEAHHRDVRAVDLRELFARDPGRGERMAAEAAGVYLDYSKNRVTGDTLALLVRLAVESGLRARIDAMFGGEKINVSEQRAVLHVALRAPRGASILVDGKNVVPDVHSVLDRMTDFAHRVRGGSWKGATGSGSATSSTSASAVRIWGRSWPTKRSGTTATAASRSASSRTSTARTSPKRSAISSRRRRCSSSRPRRSRRSRR